MLKVRLNDTNITINGPNIIIEDTFRDVTMEEVGRFIYYLQAEAFIKPDDKINVFVRVKNENNQHKKD